jgi:hypothetical protein
MATIDLPDDFREFLELLNSYQVEYLLVGGYAVAYHGYPRSTADLDVWVAVHDQNAGKLVVVLKEFGFNVPNLAAALFLKEDQIIRMGLPPLRIEVLTGISGVEFEDCFAERIVDEWDGVPVSVISLVHLKVNKRAAGRYKDLADLENLP